MRSTDLAELTASELITGYSSREFTCTDAVEACITRIGDTDPVLNTIITEVFDQAREHAAQSDARWAAGTQRSLEGVPYGLKDIVATAGIPTTGGSVIYKDYVPNADAVVAKRLSDSGAVLLAKLATFEFACGGAVNKTFGPTRNPYDVTRTTGGSSSGSGAAVAARQMPLAIGTDTGGSIRIPAAYCGLSGLKPTYGRVPRAGIMGLSWTLDHAGPMTRSVQDCAIMLDAIAGPHPSDPTALPAASEPFATAMQQPVDGMRIGRDRRFLESRMHPDVASAYEQALVDLAGAGVTIVDIDLGDFELTQQAAWSIIFAEMLSLHEERVNDMDARDEQGAAMLAATPFVTAADYLRSLRLRTRFQRRLSEAMQGLDAIVTPSMSTLPPVIADQMVCDLGGGETAAWLDIACQSMVPFNYTGNPALVVPSGTVEGMPMSIQLVGRHRDEATILAVGQAFQSVTDHHLISPSVAAA
ncbi:amidase [uncultured Gordonia sp.]|uniref:amidase n=1 Tax=uncultured Gordonia sp. TaxID=198437 RepID=UPI00258CA196|nr:amidase [uncultured Gordonia sp.]